MYDKHVDKPPDLPSSYLPISLLPSFSKILEKIILKRLNPILTIQNKIPHTQFGLKNKHSSLHQVHRIIDVISQTLEYKQYSTGGFLDAAQSRRLTASGTKASFIKYDFYRPPCF